MSPSDAAVTTAELLSFARSQVELNRSAARALRALSLSQDRYEAEMAELRDEVREARALAVSAHEAIAHANRLHSVKA